MKSSKSITVVLLLSLMTFILEAERKVINEWFLPTHQEEAAMVMMHFSEASNVLSQECEEGEKM